MCERFPAKTEPFLFSSFPSYFPSAAGAVPMAPLYVPPQRVEVQGVQYGAQVTSTAYPPFGNGVLRRMRPNSSLDNLLLLA